MYPTRRRVQIGLNDRVKEFVLGTEWCGEKEEVILSGCRREHRDEIETKDR
jgi:hypothetical protein